MNNRWPRAHVPWNVRVFRKILEQLSILVEFIKIVLSNPLSSKQNYLVLEGNSSKLIHLRNLVTDWNSFPVLLGPYLYSLYRIQVEPTLSSTEAERIHGSQQNTACSHSSSLKRRHVLPFITSYQVPFTGLQYASKTSSPKNDQHLWSATHWERAPLLSHWWKFNLDSRSINKTEIWCDLR